MNFAAGTQSESRLAAKPELVAATATHESMALSTALLGTLAAGSTSAAKLQLLRLRNPELSILPWRPVLLSQPIRRRHAAARCEPWLRGRLQCGPGRSRRRLEVRL